MVFAAPKLSCGFPAKITSYTGAGALGSFSVHSKAVRLSGYSQERWERRGKVMTGVPSSALSAPPRSRYRRWRNTSVSRRGGKEGGAVAQYIAESSGALGPLFASDFRRASTRCAISAGNMAGYLKVLSSLSRSAATFPRNPAVLAPAAIICQTQRNCEWRLISGDILSIITLALTAVWLRAVRSSLYCLYRRLVEPVERC